MEKRIRHFQLCQHDLLDYGVAWTLQKERVAAILSCGTGLNKVIAQEGATIPLSRSNLLLLLEHPSVYTMGRSAQWQEFLNPEIVARDYPAGFIKKSQGFILPKKTVPVIKTDRGGRVTYHGPGQLVAYVVCDLRPHALAAVRRHVAQLEEVAIRTLGAFGIDGQRDQKNPGVWVEKAKIGALGIKIHQGIAYHGIAINRDPDLRFFDNITPCGLENRSVTSLGHLGITVSRATFEAQFLTAFQTVFNVCWKLQKSQKNESNERIENALPCS